MRRRQRSTLRPIGGDLGVVWPLEDAKATLTQAHGAHGARLVVGGALGDGFSGGPGTRQVAGVDGGDVFVGQGLGRAHGLPLAVGVEGNVWWPCKRVSTFQAVSPWRMAMMRVALSMRTYSSVTTCMPGKQRGEFFFVKSLVAVFIGHAGGAHVLEVELAVVHQVRRHYRFYKRREHGLDTAGNFLSHSRSMLPTCLRAGFPGCRTGCRG